MSFDDSSTRIGLFDSGIGGFSVLSELFKIQPRAKYYYYCDDAFAPYGPHTDEWITQRCLRITEELLRNHVDIIVVACNTATAASIDFLRQSFPAMKFVGVEPYLKAIYKETVPSKMIVLTTESTGKSERFKRLKERLDPENVIDQLSLKNLAKMIERLYHEPYYAEQFDLELKEELQPLLSQDYTHAILGCTHYPLIRNKIESLAKLKTLCPSPYVAQRVKDLISKIPQRESSPGEEGSISQALVSGSNIQSTSNFYFYSSKKMIWEIKNRNIIFSQL